MSFAESSFIIKNDGTLWGCGYNGWAGTLGLGDTSGRKIFTQITTNVDDIKSVYGGYDYTIILKNDSTLWGCGRNNNSQLGLGDTDQRTLFTQITDNVKSAYCGYEHTIILKNDNTLWGCGWNSCGQLGLGDTSNRSTFTKIATNTNDIKSVCCGDEHTIILKNDGTLWGCGDNTHGELGLEDIHSINRFKMINTNPGNIKSIHCGDSHTLILQNDGMLWGCGKNSSGELGLGDTNDRHIFTKITNNVKSACCGNNHTFIIKNDGTLWACGLNNHNQLGLGDNTNRTAFTQITTNADNVKSVYCELNHTLILKKDGTLWTCGYNYYSELGLGDSSSRATFTQVITNTDNIKSLMNDYPALPSVIKIYDTKIGYVETLDTNNFRNIPIDTVERLKSLCINPLNTHLNCLISFDKKQTWKAFNGTNWNTILDISPENIIVNGMEVNGLNSLDKSKLISGGFVGDLDFKVVMKTNDTSKTPSITKIYIEYK